MFFKGKLSVLATIGVCTIFLSGCGGGGGQTPSSDASKDASYDYIPKKIDDALAVRFLNKASFGATKEQMERLKREGAVAWVDRALRLPSTPDIYLRKTIEMAKLCEPENNPYTIEEYLADNDKVFNKNVASFFTRRYRMSAWFEIALEAEDQLRHKVAYALSQIIVESDFEPVFTRRAEALARYFDILYRHATGNYGDLLYDISLSSGMGMFLTYNGNKKAYVNEANVTVYPDENYAREILQLFSIGLYELNMDGTPKRDASGALIPTYTQEDVNQLARVFTGWDLKRNRRYGLVGFKRGDLTHPMEFTPEYHDYGEKKVLGETIPAGEEGSEEIKKAIGIMIRHPNTAPFISKQLIMRLAKSNPSPAYVGRVAAVFRESGGDLKRTVKAILLDRELWEDMRSAEAVKFKEPLIAYTGFLKAFHVKPFPLWYFCRFGGPSDENASNCRIIRNKYLFDDGIKHALGEAPGLAPTVFNFYDNDYIPNDAAFKANGLVAPEIQIQSDSLFISFSNLIRDNLFHWEKNYLTNEWMWCYGCETASLVRHDTIEEYAKAAPARGYVPVYYIGSEKMLLDVSEELDVMERAIDGDSDGDFEGLTHENNGEVVPKAVKALISHLNRKLTGGMMSTEEEEAIYTVLQQKRLFNKYDVHESDDLSHDKKRYILKKAIFPAIRAVVTSGAYMTE